LAVIVLRIVQPYILLLTGKEIFIEYTGALFIGIVALLIVVIGLLAGLYPAFVLSSFKPIRVLKNAIDKPGSFSVWKSLVVAQFAISITLMIGTFFMYRQLQFVQQKDLGFDKSQLLSVRLKGELMKKAMLFKSDLDAQTSIAATAPATMSLVNVENTTYLEWDGMKEEDKFLITQANVTPDFIPALKMQLLNGKNFSYQQTNDTSTFIINEAAVKRMGYTVNNVIGKQVNFWGAKGTIIGVIKDFNFKSLAANIEPFILRYQPEDRYFSMFIKTVPGKTEEAIAQLQRIYKKYEKDAPLEFGFTDDAITQLYEEDQRTARIILLFASLTVFVGCLGLFGLTVFAAERRKKEVGIRKVLGAGVASLAALLSKDFLKLLVFALFIAVPVAWYTIKQWLQSYAYRISIEWWVFAVAGSLILVFALLTISIQALKTAIANPVKSLRTE
jgi:putative ABC transport system permease protein